MAARRLSPRRTVSKTPPSVSVDAALAVDSLVKAPLPDSAASVDLTHALANPEESRVERANSRVFRLSIIGFCCIAVLAGVLAVLSQQMDTNEKSEKEAVIVPSPMPTVSVQAVFTIAVQNGTGKAGEASRIAQRLTGAGFSVGSIGNASARETQTSLHVRPSDALRIDDLIASLSSIVTVSSHAADLVDGTESARLILGR